MSDIPSPIRSNTGKAGYYRDDSKNRPTGSSSSGKDFSTIMSKNSDSGKSGGGRKQVKDDEENLDELALHDDEDQHTPTSVFEMSSTQTSKLKKPMVKGTPAKAFPEKPLEVKTDDKFEASADNKKDSPPPPSPVSIMSGDKGKDMGGDKTGDKAQNSNKNSSNVGDDVPTDPGHIGQADDPTRKAPAANSRPFDLLASASREIMPDVKTPEQKGNKFNQFNREQPDLSAVNPLAAIIPQNANNNLNLDTKTEKPVAPVRSVQELINIMVKEIQSMEDKGQTDTTITLKQPPIFEGAQLVVTSFNNAKGEFNISFENLSQAAQKLISSQDNKASLMHALEQKGYQVHMINATTMEEHRIFAANVEDTRQDRNNRDGEEQQQGGHKRDQEEDET